MRTSPTSRVFGLVLLLVAVGACSSGPPAISEVIVGKDKEVTQPTSTFDHQETLYGVAKIDNPPKNGKVTGRLVIVDVAGQQPGPIPGLEVTLDLGTGMNTTNFNFTPPPAGWPDGKYRLDVALLDETGAEKSQKGVEFATTGAPAAAAEAPATDVPAADAPAEGETTPATETQQ